MNKAPCSRFDLDQNKTKLFPPAAVLVSRSLTNGINLKALIRMIRWPNSGEAAGMQKWLPEVHSHDAFKEKQNSELMLKKKVEK